MDYELQMFELKASCAFSNRNIGGLANKTTASSLELEELFSFLFLFVSSWSNPRVCWPEIERKNEALY